MIPPVAIAIAASLIEFAPLLAGLLAGPKAAAVAQVAVDVAQTITGTADGPSAVMALRGNPELQLAYQRAMMEKELELARLASQSELAHLAAEVYDRKSARAMQMTLDSLIPASLAVVNTIGFFGILIGMLGGWLSTENNPVLLLLLGSLTAGYGMVLSFFFGSSSGSKAKSARLEQLTTAK